MRKRAKGCDFTKRKSDGVRVHQKKVRCGESSQRKKAMGLELTIRESDGVRVYP